jgi:integrase
MCEADHASSYRAATLPALLDEVRRVLHAHGYSLRTEQAYLGWIRRFVMANGKRHPRELGATHVERFLTDLGRDRRASTATRNQALAALLFLYRRVFEVDVPWRHSAANSVTRDLPSVISLADIARLLQHVDETHRVLLRLLCLGGLRIRQVVQLRIDDLDVAGSRLAITHARSRSVQTVSLPVDLAHELARQGQRSLALHQRDREQQGRFVRGVLEPTPVLSATGLYLFPSRLASFDARGRTRRREAIDPADVQQVVQRAASAAGLPANLTCDMLSRAAGSLSQTHRVREPRGCYRTDGKRAGHSVLRRDVILAAQVPRPAPG